MMNFFLWKILARSLAGYRISPGLESVPSFPIWWLFGCPHSLKYWEMESRTLGDTGFCAGVTHQDNHLHLNADLPIVVVDGSGEPSELHISTTLGVSRPFCVSRLEDRGVLWKAWSLFILSSKQRIGWKKEFREGQNQACFFQGGQ